MSGNKKGHDAAMVTDHLTHPGRQLAHLFKPSFLESVAQEMHRSILERLGLKALASPDRSIERLLSDTYDDLASTYRCEYVYKNELIRQGFVGICDATAPLVVSELNISWFSGRVDLVIVDDTTTSFEIKTEFDSLDRVRRQTDLNLKIFDRNVLVCSADFTDSAIAMIDKRVGIVEMEAGGQFCRVRDPISNATQADPDYIFRCMRQREYINVVEQTLGGIPVRGNVAVEQYCRSAFALMPPETCHDGLVRALRTRFELAVNASQDVPPALAHVYCATKPAVRARLFDPSVLGRPSG